MPNRSNVLMEAVFHPEINVLNYSPMWTNAMENPMSDVQICLVLKIIDSVWIAGNNVLKVSLDALITPVDNIFLFVQ